MLITCGIVVLNFEHPSQERLNQPTCERTFTLGAFEAEIGAGGEPPRIGLKSAQAREKLRRKIRIARVELPEAVA
jgi:hypothetical protein